MVSQLPPKRILIQIGIAIVIIAIAISSAGTMLGTVAYTAYIHPTATPYPTYTPAPTYTPYPTLTPFPDPPIVLDWHLQFSTATQSKTFRCGDEFEPVVAQVYLTPITQQIIQETQGILVATNPEAWEDQVEQLGRQNLLVILLYIDIGTERPLDQPFPMITTTPQLRYSYQDLSFVLVPDSFQEYRFQLALNDGTTFTEAAGITLPRQMQPGNFYAVTIDLEQQTLGDIQSASSLIFKFNLQLVTPYLCSSSDLTQKFELNANILPAETDPTDALAYGEVESVLDIDQLTILRMEILTELTRILTWTD